MTNGSRILVSAATMLITVACNSAPPPAPADTTPKLTPVQRGEYLVKTSGCNDCHTPVKNGPNGPEPDMSRMLSGHPETIKATKPPAMAGIWMAAGSATFTAWAGP